MQRTPNLGLPQFEPTDKYRLEDYNEAYTKIDEKIKELDDKEAQLDTKLAEAQNIIDTWTQFKNNGGEVGGDISTNANISSRLVRLISSDDDHWEFTTTTQGDGVKFTKSQGFAHYVFNNLEFVPDETKTKSLGNTSRPWKNLFLNGELITPRINITQSNADGIIKNVEKSGSVSLQVICNDGTTPALVLTGGNTATDSTFRPTTVNGNKISLGTAPAPWKDLWIGSYSKSGSGYTKLPNGLIMQWGTWVNTPTTTSNSTTFTISFPTSFPSACIHVQPYASAFATSGNWAPQNCASALSEYSTSNFKFKCGTTANIRNELKWIAIGY